MEVFEIEPSAECSAGPFAQLQYFELADLIGACLTGLSHVALHLADNLALQAAVYARIFQTRFMRRVLQFFASEDDSIRGGGTVGE